MALGIVLPESSDDASITVQETTIRQLVWCGLSVLVSGGFYAQIYISGAATSDLFKGFGDDLPTISRFFFATYQFYGLLLLVGLIPILMLATTRKISPAKRNRLFYWVIASFSLVIVCCSVAVAGVYAPIFALGQIVR